MIAKEKNPGRADARASLLEGDARWKLAERVSGGSALRRATQLREMLLFIVRETVVNPGEPIHEFDIAHRVLGRRSDFNPLDDNIVRVQMAHLRKKLEQHFATEGIDEDTVITVALGSYRPVFSHRNKAGAPPVLQPDSEALRRESAATAENGLKNVQVKNAPNENTTEAAHEPKIVGQRNAIPWATIAACVLIAVFAAGCVGLWIRDRRQQQSLNTVHRALTPWKYQPALSPLWSGFFDSSRDTDVVVSDDSFLLIEELNKQQTSFYGYLGRSYINSPQSKKLNPDIQFVQELLASKSLGNTGEFKLAHRILNLDPLNQRVHLYSARQYMPALVKQNNVILIGGRISNPWAEMFEDRLNFTEVTKFEGLGVTTVVNRAPAAGEPATYTSSDEVGYCVVAYLPNPSHDGRVLLLEGTSSEATEAAGDFLLSEDQFSAFRDRLHSQELPYFEVLLKTSQVRGTPLTVTIEAYRTHPSL